MKGSISAHYAFVRCFKNQLSGHVCFFFFLKGSLYGNNMSDGTACQVLHPPNMKETSHVGWWRVGTQVFSSPCPWGNCTKSLLVPHQIVPSTLGIPAQPSLLHLSLPVSPSVCQALFVSSESTHAAGGWRQNWLYNYTCVISSRLLPVTVMWCESGAFAGTVRKGIQLKFTSGWLTLAQGGRMYTFFGGGVGGIQTFYQPFAQCKKILKHARNMQTNNCTVWSFHLNQVICHLLR